MLLIKNAHIFTCEGPAIANGFIAAKNGLIEQIGDMAACPAESDFEHVYNAEGGCVYPGFVDPHSHLGMFGDSLGFEGDDGNEETDPITPQLRAIDAINANDRCFAEALEAGVTTVITGPGSGNPIGGQMAAIKTYGNRVDDMILKTPIAMKMAFGENPKKVYHERKAAPTTRMATASLIREQLIKAREYMNGKQDKYDEKLAALVPVLKGELPVHMHCHRRDDIFTAVRIAKEFGLNYVLVHCTEGYMIADELAREGARAFVGPILSDRSKPELSNLTTKGPAIMHKAGVQIALCTDHPVIPQQYLSLCAALAAREGLEAQQAINLITIDAAKLCGIDDKVGSLKAGKHADIAVFDGDALQIATKCKAVFVQGKRAF